MSINRRILIIDDEEHVRRMMRMTLETAGYNVAEAGGAIEGLDLFADGSTWDAVVLDQRMPRMDGLEVLRRIKEINPQARVVMATAYASIELAVDAMKLGASDFVRKPMTPEVLRNAVAASLTKLGPTGTVEAIDESNLDVKIATITLNGFSILDPDISASSNSNERKFIVVAPTGKRHEVVVSIDDQVLSYVERLTGRLLPGGSSFWTEQARHLLADYLWNEGEVPKTTRLSVTNIDRDKLLIAQRWKE